MCTVALDDVVNVGRGADDGVGQPRIGINANVRLHAEVPLVALLDLIHLIKKLALARSLGRNLESGDSKADFFHIATVSDFGMMGGRYTYLLQPVERDFHLLQMRVSIH